MTILLPSAPPVVQPRVRSVPDYSFTSGPEAIELSAAAGLMLDPWQEAAVNDILAEDSRGQWAAFESALLIPRQNGKGAILECVELADLFLFGSELIIHTAHEFKTAQEAFRRVLFLVENKDDLRKKVARVRTSHGEEGIELITGQRLRFLARSGGSGRGFSCDRLIYDEAYDLPEETVAGSLPTMSARANPHVTYASSAALDKSTTLRLVMARGRREDDREPDPGLCYIEYSADPKADLDDRAQWAQANPAMGYRIREEFVEKERAAMSELTFARERLGIVDESKGSSVVDMDVWATLADTDSEVQNPVSIAIDTSPDSSFTSIAIAGGRSDGRVHVEVIDRRRGTGWVVDRVQELADRWKPAEIILDAAGPIGSLLPAFKVAGVNVAVVSTAEYGQACIGFVAATERRPVYDKDGTPTLDEDGFPIFLPPQLVHIDQPPLNAAIEAGRKRDMGVAGAWGWHRRDSTDITSLVAVTLALYSHIRTDIEPADNRLVFFGR